MKKADNDSLRREAQDRLRNQANLPDEIPAEDARRLIHELQVHQIELEMQNEELRKTQAQLEESRSQYGDLYDFAPVGYLTLAEHGLILNANLTAANQLGTERARLVKSIFHSYVLEQDKEKSRLHFIKVFKTRERQTSEVRLRARGGAEFYARLESIFIEDTTGTGRCRTSVIDISSAKRAEEELQRNREWFRTTLSSIGDGVIATDAFGLVTFLNPIGAELTGWHLEEALGQPIQSIFPIINEKTRKPTEHIVERVIHQGRIVNQAGNTALITRDGREIPVEDSAAPIRDGAGNLIGVVLVFNNVTEKRRTQEALNESERHYRSLFDNMLNGFAYCRMLFEEDVPKDFIYLNVNGTFETLTGLKNVTGKKVSEVIPGIRESNPELFEIYGRVARTGVAERFETYVEGLAQWFSVSVYSPRKEHFVAVFDVITERKRAEDELRRSRDMLELRVQERTSELSRAVEGLESMNKELQEFAFIASHDLQEPLRKIQTFGNILIKKHKESLNPEGQDYMGRITKAANRMSELLRALLDYSRTGTSQLNYQAISLTEVAREAASDLEFRINNAKGRVEIGELPTVDADASLVRQLFQNLIGNSIKYRKQSEPPIVKIYSNISNASCQIMIEDNSIGFDECYCDKIFKPFERLHGNNSPYRGIGMGLAICKKIVDRHGGQIAVRSISGKGTTFIVTLPIEQKTGA